MLINSILKLIPKSLSKRTALLICILGFVTVTVNMMVIFYFEYKSSFHTAVSYVDAQYKIMSAELSESIITEDIYSLFTTLEKVAEAVPHIDNIAITDRNGEYLTDAKVRLDRLTNTISPIEITKDIKAGEKLLGHIIFYINRESIIRQITANVTDIILMNIIVVALGTLAGIYVAGRMTRPLIKLSEQIKTVDVLELPYKFDISELSSKETKELKHVIENLSVRLKDSLDRVNEQQKEITRGERLAYLGTMSAGLAHELKNPIMAISLVLDSIASEMDENSQWHEDFFVIRREADKLVFRVNEFLEYSRPVKLVYSKTTLYDLIEHIKDQTYRNLLKNIDIIFSADSDTDIYADIAKISQTINILLNNSAEAGAVHVFISFAVTNGFMTIDYKDDGSGFRNADLSKIMLPFYTTKSSGSGLGLALCATITDAMGGSIRALENLPRGARFLLNCPCDFKCKVILQ